MITQFIHDCVSVIYHDISICNNNIYGHYCHLGSMLIMLTQLLVVDLVVFDVLFLQKGLSPKFILYEYFIAFSKIFSFMNRYHSI
jgi:hypothetical protein